MPNIQLGKNLSTLRKAHKKTQAQLSEVLNISRQAYSNYENSKRIPDIDTLVHISQYYNITLDDLIMQNLANRIHEEKGSYRLAQCEQTRDSLYITDKEIRMIMKSRSLTAADQAVLDSFLEVHSQPD